MKQTMRDHYIEILFKNFKTVKDLFIPLMGFVFTFKSSNSFKVTLIGLCILIVAYSFVSWYKRTFAIETTFIKVSEGVFQKKIIEIPVHKISSINTDASFIKRLFGVSNLNLELIGESNVKFVLSDSNIEILRQTIFKDKMKESGQTKNYLKISKKKMFFLSFEWNIILWALGTQLFWINLWFDYSDTFKDKPKNNSKEEDIDFSKLWDKLTHMDIDLGPVFKVVFDILPFIGGSVLLTLVFAFFFAYSKYRRFSIQREKNELEITYGVFNKKTHHIPINRIRSLRIYKPLRYQIFGFSRLKIDNVGMGSGGNCSIEIMPIIKDNEIEKFLMEYLPEFKEQSIKLRPQINGLWLFIIQSMYIPFIILLIVYGFVHFHFSFWFLLLFPATKGFMRWKYSGLNFNDDYVTLSRGKLFSREKIIFFEHTIQSLEVSQNFVQKKKNTLNYCFAVFSEELVEMYKVNFLNGSFKKDFLELNRK